MAQIVQYRPQVSPQNTRLPQLDASGATPAAFGAAIGQGLQNLGGGIEDASDTTAKIVTDIANQNMLRVAKQNDNDFAAYVNQQIYGDGTAENPGFRSLKGQQAIDAYPTVQKAIADKQAQISSTISVQRVKDMFNASSAEHANSAFAEMGLHTSQQREVADKAASQGRSAIALSAIAQAGENPVVLNKNLDIISYEAKSEAESDGLPPDAVAAKVLEAQSKGYEAAITGVMETNTKLAQGMFDQNVQNMDGVTATVMRRKLEAKHRQDLEDQRSAEIENHRALTDRQTTNYGQFMVGVARKTVTQDTLVDALSKNIIDVPQYDNLLSAMTSKRNDMGDPEQFNQMMIQAYQGNLDYPDVASNPTLNDEQVGKLIPIIHSVQSGDGYFGRADFKHAIKDITDLVGGLKGPTDKYTAEQSNAVVTAVNEFRQGVTGTPPGELTAQKIETIKQDAITHWRGIPLINNVLSGLPKPKYWVGQTIGSKEDLELSTNKTAVRLQSAYDSKQIDDATYVREMQNLNTFKARIKSLPSTVLKTDNK